MQWTDLQRRLLGGVAVPLALLSLTIATRVIGLDRDHGILTVVENLAVVSLVLAAIWSFFAIHSYIEDGPKRAHLRAIAAWETALSAHERCLLAAHRADPILYDPPRGMPGYFYRSFAQISRDLAHRGRRIEDHVCGPPRPLYKAQFGDGRELFESNRDNLWSRISAYLTANPDAGECSCYRSGPNGWSALDMVPEQRTGCNA
ncbi:MAG: hypothetical protein ACR2PA_06150 [Hyphomicrobiaceae bacterium]